MIPNVEGDSKGTLEEYFRNSTYKIKEKIDTKDHRIILDRNIDELTEFFIQDYILPKICIDSSKEEKMEKEHSFSNRGRSFVDFKLKIPIILEERVDKVIAHRSNPKCAPEVFFFAKSNQLFKSDLLKLCTIIIFLDLIP